MMTTKSKTKRESKKPIKLLISLVLALVLMGLLPVLTACQGNTQGNSQADTSNNDATTSTVTSDEDGWVLYEDNWYYFEDGQMVTSDWRQDTTMETEAWRYLDRNGQALSDQRMMWIQSPMGAWAYISFNENSHALDMGRELFTADSLFRFC